MLEEEEQDGRHGLDDNLLVSADVQGDLGGLHDVGGGLGGQYVYQDVQGVVAGAGGGGGGQEDLEEGDHVLGEVGEERAIEGLRGWVDPPPRGWWWEGVGRGGRGWWWEGLGRGGGQVGAGSGFPGLLHRLPSNVDVREGYVDVVVEDFDAFPDGLRKSSEATIVVFIVPRSYPSSSSSSYPSSSPTSSPSSYPSSSHHGSVVAAELALAGFHEGLYVPLPGLGPELEHLHRAQGRGVRVGARQGRHAPAVLPRHLRQGQRGRRKGGVCARRGSAPAAGRGLAPGVEGGGGEDEGPRGLEVGVDRLEPRCRARLLLQVLQGLHPP